MKRQETGQLPLAYPRAATVDRRWVTGRLPDRSGMNAFTIMVRSPDDPEERPRKVKGERTSYDISPHLSLAKTTPEDWRPKLAELLDTELTLNGISILLCSKTADVISGTPLEAALWELVREGLVEFTTEAPIFFRKTC